MSLSHISPCIPWAAVQTPLAMAIPTPSSSTSLCGLEASPRWPPRTLFCCSQGPSRATGGATVPLEAIGVGGGKVNTAGGKWREPGKKKPPLAQLKGLQVSSPISAWPALAYRWRKPHLSGLPQKCTLNKTEVGSSCPKSQPHSPRKVPPPCPHSGPRCPSPATHGEVGDGVVVRLQHLGVLEDVIPKCVEPVQGDKQVSDGHPLLQGTQGRCLGQRSRPPAPKRDASCTFSYRDSGHHSAFTPLPPCSTCSAGLPSKL